MSNDIDPYPRVRQKAVGAAGRRFPGQTWTSQIAENLGLPKFKWKKLNATRSKNG